MNDAYKIYVDQLRDGRTEKLNEVFPADLMETTEKDLRFSSPIHVSGEAYLAESELVLHLDIDTTATMPCAICNEPVTFDISLEGIYHAAPFEEIKSGIFIFKDVIREAILLELPLVVECGGKCPQREVIAKYLRNKEASDDRLPPEEGQRPFADLK